MVSNFPVSFSHCLTKIHQGLKANQGCRIPFQFQFFPELGPRGGGGCQISNFSQIQKSPQGGKVKKNYGLFPLFGTFFNSHVSLTLMITN